MRALNIAIFIFLLSLSLSTVKAAWGLPHESSPLWNASTQDIVEAGEIIKTNETPGGYDMFTVTVNSVGTLAKIVGGAVLLGSTIASFIPYPVPSEFINGLNALGATSAALAVIQFIRGVGTKWMD